MRAHNELQTFIGGHGLGRLRNSCGGTRVGLEYTKRDIRMRVTGDGLRPLPAAPYLHVGTGGRSGQYTVRSLTEELPGYEPVVSL